MSRESFLRDQVANINALGDRCQGCNSVCHQPREFCDVCWRKLPLSLRMRILSACTTYQRTSGSWVTQEFRDASREARQFLSQV